MRILWTVLKIIIALAVAVPLGIVALVLTLGVLGALFGLAVLALKLVCIGLVVYGAFRLLRHLLGGGSTRRREAAVRELPAPDPYYRDAMRELDAELGHRVR